MGIKDKVVGLFRKTVYGEVESLFFDLVKEAKDKSGDWLYANFGSLENYELLKTKDESFRKEMVFFLLDFMSGRWKKRNGSGGYTITSSSYVLDEISRNLLSLLLRSKLEMSEDELISVIKTFSKYAEYTHSWPYNPLLGRIEKHCTTNGISDQIATAVKSLKIKEHEVYGSYADERDINKRIELLLSDDPQPLIASNDPFGKLISSHIEDLENVEIDKWKSLIEQVSKEKEKSAPSKKWTQTAENIIKDLDKDGFSNVLIKWIETASECLRQVHRSDQHYEFINPDNIAILRGLVWLGSIHIDKSLTQAIEELGLLSFKKYPGYGSLSVKVGNGCLYTFSMLPAELGISRLTKFRTKIKYPSVQKQIEKLIRQTAEKKGVSIDEVEEISVPDFGLSSSGDLLKSFGEYKASLKIASVSKVELSWVKPDGKTQKSVPAFVKDEMKEELNSLKKSAKDIQTALPAQKDRIEGFYLKERQWNYNDWLKHYLNHPLISYLARKLIWTLELSGSKSVDVIFSDGDLIDINGKNQKIDNLDTVNVKLWHPITADSEDVLKWREYLVDNQIQQPFKQAFREVYLITDAERNTESYSNRFAAHVLSQHQFTALCKARGWAYSLMGQWDSHNTPTKIIPHWEIRAEYWVDANWDGEGSANGTGIYNYIFTDQVRIYDRERQLNMAEVPAIVFSEIMRDVDLFVGVTSIGNNPDWIDGGGEERYNGYWTDYSFGDLTESAKIRSQVLQNLIPRLKIAKQCTFEGNFLVVKGTKRTYKIHMGSGNILMKPNDQYLCIVANRTSKADKVFLPFEGDNQLSIILSKAFLLAADDKITDRTILSQINR